MKYNVYGYLTIGVVKTVEAGSEEEARRIAESLAVPSLCHQCANSGENDPDSWTLNEFDDPPEDCVGHVELDE